MEKRGQVAMEFLMTYGWAIIVILIAIAGLWMLGVFNVDSPNTCQISAPFSCQDVFIDEAGISFQLALSESFTGGIKSISVNGLPCTEIIGSEEFEGGQVNNIRCVLTSLEVDEQASVKFEAASKQGNGFLKTTEGTASGKVKKSYYTRSGDPSLVVAFDFEDNAKDLSEQGNDGVLKNDVDCSVEGRFGSGCYFSGKTPNVLVPGSSPPSYSYTGDFIEIPHSNSLAITKEITIEAWLNPEVTDTPGGGPVEFQDFLSKGSYNIWRMALDEGGTNNLKIIQQFGAATEITLSEENVFTQGEWTHFAWTYDGSQSQIYINGEPSGPPIDITGNLAVNTASDFTIGSWKTSDDPRTTHNSPTRFYKGFIDELAVYNRALSTDEIKKHSLI
jgi:hypothetical protein